eukprot:8246147-Alexandrium_andersonii.AAC.1
MSIAGDGDRAVSCPYDEEDGEAVARALQEPTQESCADEEFDDVTTWSSAVRSAIAFRARARR